jgi:hypothetical protein
VTQPQWKDRLDEKVNGLRTIEEHAIARLCWEHGMSVHKTQRAIEDRRKGISQ